MVLTAFNDCVVAVSLCTLGSDPEGISVERNRRQIGRLLPGAGSMTALEAMAALHRTLPEEAGQGWLKDSQSTDLGETLNAEIHDPWDS